MDKTNFVIRFKYRARVRALRVSVCVRTKEFLRAHARAI